MEQEHDRAAGAWQAEWGTLTDLLALTGSGAAWGRELVERLEVDRARMQENLDRYAERSGMDAETVARYVGDAEAAVARAVSALDGDDAAGSSTS
jgi:3-carboxy-cis,cis-muconate cycloisomerase